ncbi:MAG: SpoIIE family protein phosphatase [Methylococcaceae bacterium]
MKQTSLSYHIIRNVLLFCLALFFFTFLVNYYFTRNTIKETTQVNAVLLADKTVSRIEQELLTVQTIPQNLVWMLESANLPKDSISNFLKRIVQNNPNIYGTTIAFEPYYFIQEGRYYAPYAYRDGDTIKTMKLGSESYEYFFMDWYQIPGMLQKPYWTEPYFDEGGGNIVMSTYSVPFYRYEKGKRLLAGVVTVDISLEWLTKIIQSVKIFDTGYAFLLSANGVIVSHPNREYIMNETVFTIARERADDHLVEIGRGMVTGKSNFTFVDLPTGGNYSMYYTSLLSNKWSLGVIYPNREMYAPLKHITILLFAIIIGGLFLLSAFIIQIVNRITAPLKQFALSAKTIASGNFNTQLPGIKTHDEMLELHNSFEFMQKSLADYVVQIQQTTSAKEKIESELRIAREIQMSMIPHIFPAFPNIPQIDLFAILQPAKEVGGDLYDFFFIDDTRLCFVIGDVSGKGVPASLFMAVTRTLLRSVADKKDTPADIITKLNKSLSFNNESCMFVTFFLGIIDINTGEVEYSNAGHNPFILIQSGNNSHYRKMGSGMVLGAFEDIKYINERLTLNHNDAIFMYTDGVTEAMNHQQHLYGEKRLLELIQRSGSMAIPELVDETLNDLSGFVNGNEQSDDITILALRFH